MERDILIGDLGRASFAAEEAARDIYHMLMELEQGRPMPNARRSHAAEKLNLASEIIRRSHDD